MPPADKAARQPNVSPLQHLMPLGALPSPASVHDPLNSPTLEIRLWESQVPSSHPLPAPPDPLDAADVLPTQPGLVRVESVVTPLSDEMPLPDLNTTVGGALAPVHPTPRPPPPKRSRPGFRLPSFQALGIANPHPDRFGLDGNLTQSTIETIQRPLNAHYAESGLTPIFPDLKFGQAYPDFATRPDGKLLGGRAIQSPVRQLVSTLTPPAESEYIDWSSIFTVTTVMDSPSTEPGNGVPAEASGQSSIAPSMTELPTQISLRQSDTNESPRWTRGAIGALVENLRKRGAHADSLRIISHALPSPSSTGHIFSEVIGAVGSSTPGSASSPMTWVNVFHAIPGKFNIQDLPRSPPTTPGPAIGGEDYFTQKVFDSAVSIADYQQDLSQLPRSPCPVVPPNSVDISIVERYMPASSANEFATMFETNGPSILVDRLIELSPNNGSLLFIYPTRTGAEMFMREYLGPILDPILRGFAVTESFSAELNSSLSSMVSVDQLPEYEDLLHRMRVLCARLSQRGSAAERFHGRRPQLTLSYYSKQYVELSREAWAPLWTKQEKLRLRAALVRHSMEMQKIPKKHHNGDRRSASDLIQELLRNVEEKGYEPGREPAHEVEVSVFVITRSA